MTQLKADAPALAVSVSAVMPAAPDVVYALISDVSRMGDYSPETVKAEWTGPAPVGSPAVGTTFTGTNRIGWLRWRTTPVITRAEPGRRFEFEVPAPSRSTWTYSLAEVDSGTLVTESMRRDTPQPRALRWLQRTAGVTDREAHLRAGMTTTLERMAAAVRQSDVSKA